MMHDEQYSYLSGRLTLSDTWPGIPYDLRTQMSRKATVKPKPEGLKTHVEGSQLCKDVWPRCGGDGNKGETHSESIGGKQW